MRALLLLTLLTFGAACVDTTPRCAPDGEVRGCYCPNGRVGAQRCADDGLSLGACVCAPEDASADADAAPDTAVDSMPDAAADGAPDATADSA